MAKRLAALSQAVLLPALLCAACASPGGRAGATAPVPEPAPEPPPAIEIDLFSFGIAPDRFTIAAGTPTTLTLSNDTDEAHDFRIDQDAVNVHLFLTSHKRITTSITIDAPGTYQVFCSLPGHADQGMRGELVVR